MKKLMELMGMKGEGRECFPMGIVLLVIGVIIIISIF